MRLARITVIRRGVRHLRCLNIVRIRSEEVLNLDQLLLQLREHALHS